MKTGRILENVVSFVPWQKKFSSTKEKGDGISLLDAKEADLKKTNVSFVVRNCRVKCSFSLYIS